MRRVRIGAVVGVLALGLAVAAGWLTQRTSAAVALISEVLRDRDPGKRVGGNTIVVTGKGTRIVGVPGRPNFVIALGAHDTIVGAAKGDEIGSLASGVTIVAGRSGHELLVGGPNDKIVVAGAGHDMVFESRPGATIVLESPGDVVVDSGRADRVECVGKWRNETIYDTSTDTVDASCRQHGDRVLPVTSEPHTQIGAVRGSGSNADPFVAPCDSPSECTVTFPWRFLTGLWVNEYVPAYRCPATHPYLTHTHYGQGSIRIPGAAGVTHGVGILISAANGYGSGYAEGTATGFPNSSATNWDLGSGWYRIVLHCTGDHADASTLSDSDHPNYAGA